MQTCLNELTFPRSIRIAIECRIKCWKGENIPCSIEDICSKIVKLHKESVLLRSFYCLLDKASQLTETCPTQWVPLHNS